jgi:hypothetical protein
MRDAFAGKRHTSHLSFEYGTTTANVIACRRCEYIDSHIIDASLKRRARLLITNTSIPRQTRLLIRYALETKDPYLAQVVQRVEAGEMTIDCLYLEQP